MTHLEHAVDDCESALKRLQADVDSGQRLERCVDSGKTFGIDRSAWFWIRIAKSGRLDAVKVSGVWMCTPAAVSRWLLENTKRALVTPSRNANKPSTGQRQRTQQARAYLASLGLKSEKGAS